MSRKEFTITEENGKTVKLAIRKLNIEDYEGADKSYASKVGMLVRESTKKNKFLLRSEIDKFLKERGIWSIEDDNKIIKLRKDVEDNLNKLRRGGVKLSEGRSVAISTMEKRNEIVQIMQKRQTFDDTTIESMATSEKAEYLTYCCIVYADTGDQ
jgi:hypothetical protein